MPTFESLSEQVAAMKGQKLSAAERAECQRLDAINDERIEALWEQVPSAKEIANHVYDDAQNHTGMI